MPELVPALLLFLLPLAYSPGPGNLFFAATGARFGLAATLPASLGYHAATLAVTLVLGAGFLGAIAAAPLLGSLMRWGGAAYVLWLAAGFARAGVLRDAADRGGLHPEQPGRLHAVDSGGRPAGTLVPRRGRGTAAEPCLRRPAGRGRAVAGGGVTIPPPAPR